MGELGNDFGEFGALAAGCRATGRAYGIANVQAKGSNKHYLAQRYKVRFKFRVNAKFCQHARTVQRMDPIDKLLRLQRLAGRSKRSGLTSSLNLVMGSKPDRILRCVRFLPSCFLDKLADGRVATLKICTSLFDRNFMIPTVSVEAARRQSFGAMFNPNSRDKSLADVLLTGKLEMSPHPEWVLPANLTWTEDPFTDRNWRAQLHMLRWMDPLRRRAVAGDREAASAWIRYAKSWVDSNLDAKNSAREAWMDMVDGIRALELCFALPFVSEFDPNSLVWLVPAIEAHAAWLMDGRNLGHSNHALHQHQGLFVCGAVLCNENMMLLAERRMVDLFRSQYDAQGVNAEGAIYYHMANANWWAVARRRLEVERRDVEDSFQLLDSAAIALAHSTKPDGTFVSIGDTDGGNARTIGHPATKWVSTAGADGEPPADTVRLYDAGYFYARSGWGEQERDFRDETFLSLSFGSPKRVHGHRDGLSMTYSSMGHEWITDPGKFQYGTSEMRDYCLSRKAHSLPYIQDWEHDETSVVECVRQDFSSSVYDTTFVDNGYKGIRISRRVIYSVSGEYAVVIDNIDSDEECTAVQNWQCGKGTTAKSTSAGFELTSPSGGAAAVLFTGTRPESEILTGVESPLAGWVATGWKKREAAPSLRFSKTGKHFRFITLLASGAKGMVPTMETVRHKTRGIVRLRVSTGRVSEQIVISSAQAQVIGFSADAAPVTPGRKSNNSLLNPSDIEARSTIFTEIHDAYRTGWNTDDQQVRLDEGLRLQKMLTQYELKSGIDLGLAAAVSDLKCLTQKQIANQNNSRERSGLINWNKDAGFRPVTPNLPVVSVVGTDAELPTFTEDTLVSYLLGTMVLPALVSPAPGTTLTVMLHGATDRARTKLPLFQRLRFQKTLNAGPTVCFSDPTLDLSSELRLGWYLGSDQVALADEIVTATRALALSLGCKDVVFQGSSGGGFAALQMGARFPGSHVVALNPQTDVRQYLATFARNAFVASYGDAKIGEKNRFRDRIDVMHALQTLDSRTSITLVMNEGDVFHEKKHAVPLRRALRELSSVDIDEVNFDLGPGHKGLSNEQYAEVMKRVYAGIPGTKTG